MGTVVLKLGVVDSICPSDFVTAEVLLSGEVCLLQLHTLILTKLVSINSQRCGSQNLRCHIIRRQRLQYGGNRIRKFRICFYSDHISTDVITDVPPSLNKPIFQKPSSQFTQLVLFPTEVLPSCSRPSFFCRKAFIPTAPRWRDTLGVVGTSD